MINPKNKPISEEQYESALEIIKQYEQENNPLQGESEVWGEENQDE